MQFVWCRVSTTLSHSLHLKLRPCLQAGTHFVGFGQLFDDHAAKGAAHAQLLADEHGLWRGVVPLGPRLKAQTQNPHHIPGNIMKNEVSSADARI